MIQVENLTKYYGDLAAIKDVSFNVDNGVLNLQAKSNITHTNL